VGVVGVFGASVGAIEADSDWSGIIELLEKAY
jgi:hypothetical protein